MGRSAESLAKRRLANAEWRRKNKERVNTGQRRRAAGNPSKISALNAARRKTLAALFAAGAPRATSKRCSICKQVKPAANFYISNQNNDGLHGWCKECSDKRTVDRYRLKVYGVDEAKYQEMIAQQNGACAICGTLNPGRRCFSVDHEHSTGRVRGLLCNSCNIMLGLAKDSIEILKSAITYLGEMK